MSNEEYIDYQFGGLEDVGPSEQIKIKVSSESGQTNWINITKKQAGEIRELLSGRGAKK